MFLNFTISEILEKAKKKLSHLSTPCLDAEVLLAHVLNVTRSYLHTWPERELSRQEINLFEWLIERRKQGEPIAYLIGYREFWSLKLSVTKDVLIPRCETELLVEVALNLLPSSENILVADLGTGSGAIALALAHERPSWNIIGADNTEAAIKIAKSNADRLALKNVNFYLSDWCEKLSKYQFDAILSNPPYLSENDIHLERDGVCFEPKQALVSGNDGLESIKKIIFQIQTCLKKKGLLFLEHGCEQAHKIREILVSSQYKNVTTVKDIFGLERVTYGIMQ
jgi:release factor glutamine methyltransferase